MPICIECRYPVPQLYHVLQSHNPKSTNPTPKPSQNSSSINLANHPTSQKTSPTSPRVPRAPPPGGEAKRPSAGSGDVRLTQCPRCKRFADKYVEHDYVVLFIDLVLVKPQVYRHILFNRFSHDAETLDPSIRRLGILLLLFDVYLTMIHIESLPPTSINSPISALNVFAQWGFFVFVCAASTLAQHLTIRWLANIFGLCGGEAYYHHHHHHEDQHESPVLPNAASGSSGGGGGGNGNGSGPNPQSSAMPATAAAASASVPIDPPSPPTPSSISTALFVSSCMSLFPILMIVWRPDESTSPGPTAASSTATSTGTSFLPGLLLSPGRGVGWVRSGVSWAVALQNLEALRILLGCGYLAAGGLVVVGGAVRFVVRTTVMGAVGLNVN